MVRNFFTQILCIAAIFGCSVFAEENFFLIDGETEEVLIALGSDLDRRVSPCSTFKIVLSLIGYDAEVLKDSENPTWLFQEGYDDFVAIWRGSVSPQTWMQSSCVWYSKILALRLGMDRVQKYLGLFEYGNQDLSGGFPPPGFENPAWICSSLKISPREQAHFLQAFLRGHFPLSAQAVAMTKALVWKEQLSREWRLFGKTGSGGSIGKGDPSALECGWFVGWIEKKDRFFPFAYLFLEKKVLLDQRVVRAKQLLNASGIMDKF